MEGDLVIEVDDETFERIRRLAIDAGVSPDDRAGLILQRELKPAPPRTIRDQATP